MRYSENRPSPLVAIHMSRGWSLSLGQRAGRNLLSCLPCCSALSSRLFGFGRRPIPFTTESESANGCTSWKWIGLARRARRTTHFAKPELSPRPGCSRDSTRRMIRNSTPLFGRNCRRFYGVDCPRRELIGYFDIVALPFLATSSHRARRSSVNYETR